jgi:hypothetical protein
MKRLARALAALALLSANVSPGYAQDRAAEVHSQRLAKQQNSAAAPLSGSSPRSRSPVPVFNIHHAHEA